MMFEWEAVRGGSIGYVQNVHDYVQIGKSDELRTRSRPNVALRVSLEPAPAPATTTDERLGARFLRRRNRRGQLLLLLLELLLHRRLLLLLHGHTLASRASFVRSDSAERATREGAHQRSTEGMRRSRGTLGLQGGGDERFDASAEVVGFAASQVRKAAKQF